MLSLPYIAAMILLCITVTCLGQSTAVEPDTQLPTITVGSQDADVIGTTGQAIQIAIDAIAYRGGGVVRVLPGEYLLNDSIHLRSNITLLGVKGRTILRRGALVTSRIIVDADIGQKQMTLENSDVFKPGMGICVYDDNRGWSYIQVPRTIIAIADSTLHLNDYLGRNHREASNPKVYNYFPMIQGDHVDHATVDGFIVDGAVPNPEICEQIMEIRGSVVHLTYSKNCIIRNVVATNGYGDGILVEDASLYALVEDCEAYGNTHHGLHFGSHSAYGHGRRNLLHDNGSDGMYICWGIHHSVFEHNVIHNNGGRMFRSGFSIGHKDTDNLIANNHIYNNRKYGVCVRTKTQANGAHRNIFRENLIENNGTPKDQIPERYQNLPAEEVKGCGFNIAGITEDMVLDRNIIRDTRSGESASQLHAVYIHKGVSNMNMIDNEISDHPAGEIVDHSGDPSNELQDVND